MKFPTPDISDYRGFTITFDLTPSAFLGGELAYHVTFSPPLIRFFPFGRSKKRVLAQAKKEIDSYLALKSG